MKKIIVMFVSMMVVSFLSYTGINLPSVGIDTIKDSLLAGTSGHIKFFTGDDVAQKQKMLETLKIEYQNYLEKIKQLVDVVDKQMNGLKKEIELVKSMLLHHQHNSNLQEFMTKKLQIFNKKYQLLLDMKEARQQIAELMKQHVEYLDKFFQTSQFIDHIEEKTLYSFADLQKITRQISTEKEVTTRLGTKKENEESIISRTESLLVTKDKELKTIQDTLELLKKSSADVKNQMILLDAEKESLIFERELIHLRLEEHQKMIEFLDSQIFVSSNTINALQKDLIMVRSRMKVDKQDVLQYQQIHTDVKKEVAAHKIELTKKRTDLAAQKQTMQEDLDKLVERYKISVANMSKIEEWDIALESINQGYGAFVVSLAQTKLMMLEQKIDEVRVELFLQDAKLVQAQALEDAVKSLYAITQVKFNDIDQLEKERLFYKDLKNTIQNMVKVYQDRLTEMHAYMKLQYKKVANIKKHQEEFKNYNPEDGLDSQRKYNEGLLLLTKALKLIEEQGDVSLKLTEQYGVLLEQKEETLVLSQFMLQELDLIGVWHRSNRAVTLAGIYQIIPNLITFAQNVYGVMTDYCAHFHIFKDLYDLMVHATSQFFTYILSCIFLYIIFLSLQAILQPIYAGLMLVTPDIEGIFIISRVFAVLCGFVQEYIGSLFIWFFILWLLSFHQFSIAFSLLFYLYSICFLIYISRAFLRYALRFNRSIQYALIAKSFEHRFSWVFSFFTSSTIFILFFRKMFMLVMMYQQSEFPIILLRLYHVIIFISIVFSIEKNQLLHYIPQHTVYTKSVALLIQDYYYLFAMALIFILILSDPYLGGYGHLIWYVVVNVLSSACMFAILYLLHNAIKTVSAWMFFKEYGEFGLKERFEYAKTWYAVFVTILFFIFSFIAIVFAARIWGYAASFDQVDKVLNYPIMSWPSFGGTKIEYLRVVGILRLISSVFIGFILAFLFRRYILQRVFDIQYVDPGVQDTIMTIARYVIVLATIFIGFAREGLGSYFLSILILGLIGFFWSFKDLFADVVAYFFILVQRPIKVGDYIQVDEHIMGVVKKISPRAVILRRKNSVTLIVPNAIILKSSLCNWNSTRGYIAFDDIVFSVPFGTDPAQVKKLLYQAVLSNPDVLKVPEPIVRLDDFSDNGYTFMVRGFISSGNTLNQWTIASDVRILIVSILKSQGISIAQPVMNIKLKSSKEHDRL